ncbi:hypothetical protein F4Z99_03560 [Candidatus Poribacteria bacterium]|nr:hypothetical protein [Candidatus Poribacteria bacterium]
MDIDDLPADDIVCLIDRFCYISHLAAMQRWGVTNRRSHNLMLSRPDNETVQILIADIMKREAEEVPWDERPNPPWPGPFRLTNIAHPLQVRGRLIQLRQTRNPGKALKDHNGFARVSTIGQTFLDMLQQPDLCGGMAHVLEVWDEHAHFYLDAIIEVVNDASSVVKCRAGHIIEERLGIKHPVLDAWQACAQRGGSSRLDPKRPYIPKWSEKWMISLNV